MAGQQERDEALARVEKSMSKVWRWRANMAFRHCADNKRQFSTDDVWALLEEWDVRAPRERRAMGVISREFIKDDYVTVVRYMPSERPECHRRPIAVYEKVKH